jgi:hypothetical protein
MEAVLERSSHEPTRDLRAVCAGREAAAAHRADLVEWQVVLELAYGR